MNPGVNKSTTHSSFFFAHSSGAAGFRTVSLFPLRIEYCWHAGHRHCERLVGLPAKWHASLLHPHKHTDTHPACPVSCHSLHGCRDLCQAAVTVQGSEVTTPSTHTPVFICLFVGLCSFISWSLRHSVRLSLYFFFSPVTLLLADLFFPTCHLRARCRNHRSVCERATFFPSELCENSVNLNSSTTFASHQTISTELTNTLIFLFFNITFVLARNK